MRRGIPNPGRAAGSTLNTFAVLNEEDEEQERLKKIEKLRRETESLKNQDWADVDDSDVDAASATGAADADDSDPEPEEQAFHMELAPAAADEKPAKAVPKKQLKRPTEKKTLKADELAKRSELQAKIAAATKKLDHNKEEDPETAGEPGAKKKKSKSEKKEARKHFER